MLQDVSTIINHTIWGSWGLGELFWMRAKALLRCLEANCCPRSCKMGRDVAALLSLKLTARRSQNVHPRCGTQRWSGNRPTNKISVWKPGVKDLNQSRRSRRSLGPNSACCQSKKANLLSFAVQPGFGVTAGAVPLIPCCGRHLPSCNQRFILLQSLKTKLMQKNLLCMKGSNMFQ